MGTSISCEEKNRVYWHPPFPTCKRPLPPPPPPGTLPAKKKWRPRTRHLPIVLVKVAYYASGSAHFLPKLCSNYARFSKLCYFFKKLFCGTFFTLVTLLVPLLLYFTVVDSRRLSRASCAGFGLSSLFSQPCKLSGCKFTALDGT